MREFSWPCAFERIGLVQCDAVAGAEALRPSELPLLLSGVRDEGGHGVMSMRQ